MHYKIVALKHPVSSLMNTLHKSRNSSVLDRLGAAKELMLIDRFNTDGTFRTVHDAKFGTSVFADEANDFLSAGVIEHTDPRKIQVVIPTYQSEEYLLKSVEHYYYSLLHEKKYFLKDFDIDLLIAVNGKVDFDLLDKLTGFIRSVNGLHDQVSLSVMYSDIAGKVNTMNASHQIALSEGRGTMVFMDDDVFLPPGSLSNAMAAMNEQKGFSLIGGNPLLLPPQRELSDLEKTFYTMSSLRRTLTGYSLPMGRMMALRTESYPVIPTNIVADDVYMNGFFIRHGLHQEIEHGSPVNFHGSSSFYQWLLRSQRISSSDEQIIGLLPENKGDELRSALHNISYVKEPSFEEKFHIDLMKYVKQRGVEALQTMTGDIDQYAGWGADTSTKGIAGREVSHLEKMFNLYLFPRFLQEGAKRYGK